MTCDDPKVPVMPAGQPDADRVTVELKPFAGMIDTVEVPVDPAIADAAVALIAKLGAEPTVIAMVVLADRLPLVPLTVNMKDPGATLAPTPIVTTEDPFVGFVPKVPVMPAGHPDADKVTVALKPFTATTETVEVPVDPAAAVADAALRVKLGAALTVRAIVVLADSAPLVPLTVSV